MHPINASQFEVQFLEHGSDFGLARKALRLYDFERIYAIGVNG
jgi:hypothetical protein